MEEETILPEGEVQGVQTKDDEEPEELAVEEVPVLEEVPEEVLPIMPTLSSRSFTKDLYIDKEAKHYCEAEQFRIDVSGTEFTYARIMFVKDADISYDAEIGGLPDGIDVRFESNDDYLHHLGSSEDSLQLVIENQSGSYLGDFSVPIIYTAKGVADSPVICQITIVNL